MRAGSLLRRLPWLLVVSRLVLAPAVILLALGEQRTVLAAMLVYALCADIADGQLARRMGVATARLRQADSSADLVFWSSVLVAACLLEPAGMRARAFWIVLVVALELAVNVGLAIGTGVIACLDGIAILVLLPAWQSDVPSALTAWRLRREA